MSAVLDLAVIVIVGVIIANAVSGPNVAGTGVILCGIGWFWKAAVNGMLGQQVPPYTCGGTQNV
jgi:hypothetical protein